MKTLGQRLSLDSPIEIDRGGMRLRVGAYDLQDEFDTLPTGSNNYLAHVTPAPGQSIVGYATSDRFANCPSTWGALGFVPAQMPARFRTSLGRLQVCRLSFTPERAETLVERPVRWSFDNLGDLLNLRSREMVGAMRRLAEEVQRPGLAHESYIDAIGSAVVIELCRRFAGAEEPRALQHAKLAPWQLRRIEDHARSATGSEPTSVAAFAQLCGVSASHLARCFKQTTGTTLHAYVESIRIDRARALLSDGDLNFNEIASAVGFASASYFSTAFRRATGETPSAYRASARAMKYARSVAPL